jgi:hypothetical protein
MIFKKNVQSDSNFYYLVVQKLPNSCMSKVRNQVTVRVLTGYGTTFFLIKDTLGRGTPNIKPHNKDWVNL